MTKLYSEEYALEQRKAYKKWLFISLGVMIGALIVCVFLCFFVNTRRVNALFYAVALLSIAAGWAYILFLGPKKCIAKREYRHCENMLSKTDLESNDGILSVSDQVIRIPGSIRVRSVRLINGADSQQYHLNANFSLPKNGTKVRLTCAGRYIVGYEVADDD